MIQRKQKKRETGRHPEAKEGEIFIGHMSIDFFNSNCEWETKRVGNAVNGGFPDSDGHDISFPVFVKRSEIEKEIKKCKEQGLSTDGLEELLN